MRRLGASLAVSTLVLAAGCAGGAEMAASDIVTAAAARTERAGTARVTLTVSLAGVAPEPLSMAGTGAIDLREDAARVTFDIASLAGARHAVPGPHTDMDVFFDGTFLYVRLPYFAEHCCPVAPEPWLKVSRGEPLHLVGLHQLPKNDPNRTLALLAAPREAEPLGGRRYRVTLGNGAAREPADVWIDDEGFVRRIAVVYRDIELSFWQNGDMTVTLELDEIGREVAVEPPSPDDVMTSKQLARGGV